jgi:hypothetical protein
MAGGGGGKGGSFGGGKGGGGGKGRFEWRVLVTGLPNNSSWQDLKDFLRQTGDVVYADVKDGEAHPPPHRAAL